MAVATFDAYTCMFPEQRGKGVGILARPQLEIATCFRTCLCDLAVDIHVPDTLYCIGSFSRFFCHFLLCLLGTPVIGLPAKR